VLIDAGNQRVVRHGFLHENVDYTPYEDMLLCGFPVATISRGKIVMRDGKFCGSEGDGKYLYRSSSMCRP
jgi:dihydropyrimidinase